MNYNNKAIQSDITQSAIFSVSFGLTILNAIFSLFSLPTVQNEFHKDNVLKVLPENHVSLLSKLWFWWINDLIYTGYKRDLVKDDLWKMELSESSGYNTERLEFEWKMKSDEYIDKIRSKDSNQKKIKKPSFSWTLVKVFHGKFIGGSCLRLINDLLN